MAAPRHKTIGEEWRAMGPFSRIMAVLGLFGFIVGIPGWLSSEYWTGKKLADILVPQAIAEQLNPQQVAQLTEALTALQTGGGAGGTPQDQVNQALEAAGRGNLKLAEGLLEEVYRNSAKEVSGAQAEQALAARHLAALAVVHDADKALTLYRQSVKLDPASAEGWLGLGDAATTAGTVEEATEAYRTFLTLTPLETAPQLHAAGLDRLGDALLAQGAQAEALKAYATGIDISRQMAKAEPDKAEWQRNITVSLKKTGDVFLAQGAYDDAAAANAEAVLITRSLIAKAPGETKLRRDLAAFLGIYGEIKLRQGDGQSAAKAYEEALALARGLLEAAPDDPEANSDLSAYLVKTGDLKIAQGEADAAAAAYFDALRIREQLARLDPANMRWQRDLVVNLIKIGDVKAGTGKPGEALDHFEHARLIAGKLAGQDPANAGLQRDLSVSVNKAGDARRAMGDAKGAAADHGEGLLIVESLARRFPDNAELQRDLIVSYFNLAEDGSEPAANYRKASAQAQAMKDRGILMQNDEWMIGDLQKRAEEAENAQ